MPLSIFFSHRTGKRFANRARLRKTLHLSIDREEVIGRGYGIQCTQGNG